MVTEVNDELLSAAELHDRASVLVDTADVPGGGKLRLFRHGQDWEMRFGDEQLMGSWCFRSEQVLATVALRRLGDRASHVLIGGLGMGYTLAAARAALPPNATIVVAELVPKVVTWAAGPLAHILGDYLADPRVSLVTRDVHDLIAEERGGFDAILLDVDNGPDGVISLANERLYCAWGLRSARAALRDGGVLAIWSAYRDDDFVARLGMAGFDVEELTVEHGGSEKDAAHVIWLAVAR